jgi:ABC-type branched-subunit amino acid transport system substrate-binding protein
LRRRAPLTGPYGAEAQDQVRAAQVAIAEFNETGGLKGRQAELLAPNDKLKPGEGATRALELIQARASGRSRRVRNPRRRRAQRVQPA